MFQKEISSQNAKNSVLMIVSNSSDKSSHLKTSKLTIFTSLNTENIKNYKNLNKVKIDLKSHISAPVDSISRIWRKYPLRGQSCDIYLLVTELLEIVYFTTEFGVLNFKNEEIELLQETFNYYEPGYSNMSKNFLKTTWREDKTFVAGSFWVSEGASHGYLGLPIYKFVSSNSINEVFSRASSYQTSSSQDSERKIELQEIVFLQLQMVKDSDIFKYNKFDFNESKIKSE